MEKMRDSGEMMDAILAFARENDDVRAVFMNGSRANPSAPVDEYMDYDIVFVVNETKPFIDNQGWISKLGEISIVQQPDRMDLTFYGKYEEGNEDFLNKYAWLMLFKDGNRIDLSVETKDWTLGGFNDDGLTIILMDKDGMLPEVKKPNDSFYHVKKPGGELFRACINEFWWCMQNVAKGIARDELSYAKWMYDSIVRKMLHMMMDWSIGMQHDYAISTGKAGKYYKNLLTPGDYEEYRKTYSDSDYVNFWNSLFTMCAFYIKLTEEVSSGCGLEYSRDEQVNMTEYLRWVRQRSE